MTPNGEPSLGEVSRQVAEVKATVVEIARDVSKTAVEVGGLHVGLDAIERRVGDIESEWRSGKSQRSGAAWQILFIVLGVVGSGTLAFVLAQAGR